MASSGEGSHDKSSQMGIEFIWRGNYTRANLLDLSTYGWIKTNQKYITPLDIFSLHHCHSLSSNRVGVVASSN
jgi:hypothetical protein